MYRRKKISIKDWLKGFNFAFNGLIYVFKNEQNARIHFVVSVFVISAGLYIHLSLIKWYLVICCIGSVIAAELFNTAIELITDKIWPEKNNDAKIIKDISAGAVLIISISAAIIGVLVFYEPICNFLSMR